MSRARTAVAVMTLSMLAFTALKNHEGYSSTAVIPVKNDRPTIGHGSTFWEDGTPVKMGETITPERAVVLAKKHVSKEEEIFRRSINGAYLHQEEFDLYMDFVYQFGIGNWNGSSMRKNILKQNYRAACDSLLRYKYGPGKFDCSTPGNRICRGVWDRQVARHAKCVAAQ